MLVHGIGLCPVQGREGTVGGIRQAPSFAAGLLAVPAFISVLGLLHLPVEGPTICSVLNSLGTDLETLPPMAKELGVRV